MQGWVTKTKGSLTGVTALGGDFGFGGHIEDASGGAVTGLLKAVRREFPELRVQIIDAPADEPPQVLAASICAELASGGADVEVGFARRRRRVVRMVPDELAACGLAGIVPGSQWVITGGARGITNLVARELGRRYGIHLHLLGTSPLGKVEETLSQMRTDGMVVQYHPCDAGDRDALNTALASIRSSSGPITGVVHGAGFEAAASFPKKQSHLVQRTLRGKVQGAEYLLRLTAADPLTHFIAFGSVSGRFGGLGQTDYSLASDLLAKMVQVYRRERPSVAAVTFHWPAWSGAGMAMRPESKLVLEASGVQFLSPRQGIACLVRELEAGCPEAEVMIGFDNASPPRAAKAPLLDRVLRHETAHLFEAELLLRPDIDFIRDHQWRGASLLPAAGMIEILAQAAQQFQPGSEACLVNFAVANPMIFAGDPLLARVHASSARITISTEFRNSSGKLVDSQRPVASASFAESRTDQPPPNLALSDPLDWHPVDYTSGSISSYYGESMRLLREFAAVPGGAVGRIQANGETRYLWNPALLDACFVACGIYSLRKLNQAALVQGVDSLARRRTVEPTGHYTVRLWHRGSSNTASIFDFVLLGQAGDVMFQAEGVRLVHTGVTA